MANYVLSQESADGLKRLLNSFGGTANGVTGDSGRQTGFVVVTGEAEGDGWTANVVVWDALEAEWVTYSDVIVYPDNEDAVLIEGAYYLGMRSGDNTEGNSVWIVHDLPPNVCCGLKIIDTDDDASGCDKGTIVVDGQALAGAGINWDAEECAFSLDPGCGITLEGGKKVGVQAGALAGEGLTAGPGCKLNVNTSGCLTVNDDNQLTVSIGGTFSAITALSIGGTCPNKTLNFTTTAFGFNGCSLEQISYNTDFLYLPCCYPCGDQPAQYWCYAGSCSTTQTGGATGPFDSLSACQAACGDDHDCTTCDWTISVNGETYTFEESGGQFIAAGPDGTFFYLSLPVGCTGEYQVQNYDGALEICKWVATYDGTGCHTLTQGTNNGIPFDGCIASEITLCCDGGGDGGGCSFSASLKFKIDGSLCGKCNAFSDGFHPMTDVSAQYPCTRQGSFASGVASDCPDDRGFGFNMTANDDGTVTIFDITPADYCAPPPGTYTPSSWSPFALTITYSTGGKSCCEAGTMTLTIEEE